MTYSITDDVNKAKAWECFFMEEMGRLLDLKLLWNPDRFIIDWSVVDKSLNIITLIEAKVRNNHSVNKWDDFMVGLRKYQWGVNYYLTTGIPFVLAFRFSDAIVTYKHNPEKKLMVKYTGRSVNKRWSQDVTPCVHILKSDCKIYNLPYSIPVNMVEDLNTRVWKDISQPIELYLNKIYEGKSFVNYE